MRPTFMAIFGFDCLWLRLWVYFDLRSLASIVFGFDYGCTLAYNSFYVMATFGFDCDLHLGKYGEYLWLRLWSLALASIVISTCVSMVSILIFNFNFIMFYSGKFYQMNSIQLLG